MTNIGADSIANYEATVASGLEVIAQSEVKDKIGVDSETQRGRVWFSTDALVQDVLKLKSINNLFVIMFNKKLEDNDIPRDASSLESLLMRVGDECDWRVGLEKWKQMCKFELDLDKILTKDENLREFQPKFRVSSNRFGLNHKFTSPEICSVFGHVIDTKFGWPIKLKDFDLQVMANFNENHLYVGITLTPLALDRRNIVSTGYTTLRAATCYSLLRVANIQTGDIIMDPMAGSGAIPVECCYGWGEEWLAFTLAGEIESKPLCKCKVNLDSFRAGPPRDILQLDLRGSPIRDACIDVIVSDLPFGRRHGSKKHNRSLYPELLSEMGRMVRPETGRAALLTQDFKSMNHAYRQYRHLWTMKSCNFVKVGNLSCHIYLMQRSSTKYGE